MYPERLDMAAHDRGVAVVALTTAIMHTGQISVIDDATAPALTELRAKQLAGIVEHYQRVSSLTSSIHELDIPVRLSHTMTDELTRAGKRRANSPPTGADDGTLRPSKNVAFSGGSPGELARPTPAPQDDVRNAWTDCVTRAAQAGGFGSEAVVRVFDAAPRNQPIKKVLQALQFMCDIAGKSRLLQLWSAIQHNPKDVQGGEMAAHKVDCIEMIASMHSRINSFITERQNALYRTIISQMLYNRLLEAEVDHIRDLKTKAGNERRNYQKRMNRQEENEREGKAPARDLGPMRTDSTDALMQWGFEKHEIEGTGVNVDALVRKKLFKRLKEVHGSGAETSAVVYLDEGKKFSQLIDQPSGDLNQLRLFPIFDDLTTAKPSLDLLAHTPPEALSGLETPLGRRG